MSSFPDHPAVRPLWTKSGVHVWFHYCRRPAAPLIISERLFMVPETAAGLYVTNLEPGTEDEQLLTDLFVKQRTVADIDGVVVLRRDETMFPVERIGAHAYLHRAEGDVDLAAILLGGGVRDEGSWRFDQELYVPW